MLVLNGQLPAAERKDGGDQLGCSTDQRLLDGDGGWGVELNRMVVCVFFGGGADIG